MHQVYIQVYILKYRYWVYWKNIRVQDWFLMALLMIGSFHFGGTKDKLTKNWLCVKGNPQCHFTLIWKVTPWKVIKQLHVAEFHLCKIDTTRATNSQPHDASVAVRAPDSVQVGSVAGVEPPGGSVFHGAVPRVPSIRVMISVPGTEHHAVVVGQAVSSITAVSTDGHSVVEDFVVNIEHGVVSIMSDPV